MLCPANWETVVGGHLSRACSIARMLQFSSSKLRENDYKSFAQSNRNCSSEEVWSNDNMAIAQACYKQ